MKSGRRNNMDILDSYIEAKRRMEEKAAKKRELLAKLEEEYVGVEEQYEQERAQLFDWMNKNQYIDFPTEKGRIVIRPSRPKYKVVDDGALVSFLSEKKFLAALTYKKGAVNTLRENDEIPEEIVNRVIEDEIVIYLEQDRESESS